MVGEALRDVAVLIFVFYPLEAYFQGKFDWSNILLALAFAGTLMHWGMILEGRDEL